MKGKRIYRVLEYYNMFFARRGFMLQERHRFLWYEWWVTKEMDSLGMVGRDWALHYQCPIVQTAELQEEQDQFLKLHEDFFGEGSS